MKKVFLIGDSICLGPGNENDVKGSELFQCGYGYHVAEMLKGKAEVFMPAENCRFVQYTIRYIHEWAYTAGVGADVDLVHWNNGLWDVLRLLGEPPLTPLDTYKEFLLILYTRIKKIFPNAKIIFAYSTAVSEKWMNEGFMRRNADIERYNAAAREVLEPLGVVINDLYTFSREVHKQYGTDYVHYSKEGARILAAVVTKAIMEQIGEDKEYVT